MAINPNELILDRVREITFSDLSTGEILARLTNLEDPSLNTSANGEDIVDAIGSVITTIYRAKTATFTATNSLFSLDLAAQQFGAKKQIADNTNQISVSATESLKVVDNKVTLKNTPIGDIKYIYKLGSKQLSAKYILGASASADEFTIIGKTITVPTSISDGDVIYVEYTYSSSSAVKVSNETDKFPESVGVKIYAIFRDICNENVVYAGAIVAPKAKINPESIEIALTSTGKHAFEIKFMEEYCEENADLFSIIVAKTKDVNNLDMSYEPFLLLGDDFSNLYAIYDETAGNPPQFEVTGSGDLYVEYIQGQLPQPQYEVDNDGNIYVIN